jgi:enoyl-CoA hydratase
MMAYETIQTEIHGGAGLIRLERPKALNALNFTLMREVVAAAKAFDADNAIGAMVITGSSRAFAAGADIKDMQAFSYSEAYLQDLWAGWDGMKQVRKPVIAAVCGYALGGGCELAMMCDMIFASETAQFGQPEITLGTMPGMGGTQRLTRAVGKAKAMDLCLTGRMMDAIEAERAGLVARIVPEADLLEVTLAAANRVAGLSRPAVLMIKEAINQAFEVPLEDGLRFEKRLFHSTFAFEDQKEGMAAFVEKRTPVFRNL